LVSVRVASCYEFDNLAMRANSLLKAVAEQKPLMNPGTEEFESDEEAVLLAATKRPDQVMRKPSRFVFGLAAASAALLLAIASFIAPSWVNLRPGFRNTSQVTASTIGASLVSEEWKWNTEKFQEKVSLPPFDGQLLKAVFEETSANTCFEEFQMEDGTVSYRHRNGLFITAKNGERVVSSPPVGGSAQFFGKKTNEDGTISLMVHGGSWLTALPSGVVVADAPNIQAWQTFTQKNGENGTIMLRSTHGKYLGVQSVGEEFAVADRSLLMKDAGLGHQITAAEAISVITTAEADSIGSREKFTIVYNTADGTVSFKTKYGTFLTSPTRLDGLVSGDSTTACGREAFSLIKRDGGKVSLQTFDGRYITALTHGFLVGDSKQLGDWESFVMENHGDGTVSFKSYHGRYITASKVPLSQDGAWTFAE